MTVEKDNVNNLTKFSINNGTENFNNFIVIEGLHDLQGYGLGPNDHYYVSFGSDETVGTDQSIHGLVTCVTVIIMMVQAVMMK